MIGTRPLNAGGAAPAKEAAEAGELSRSLLAEARAAEAADRRARLEQQARLLRAVDPTEIDGDNGRLAFWINLYNALLLQRLRLRPMRGSVLRHPRLFSTAAYDVGGHEYSLNLIEHGVLRCNRRPPYRLRRPLRGADPRRGAAPSRLDPRIHFALNCGAHSCPPIHVYEPDRVDEQLELATRSYLRAETSLDAERGRVTLPRLMRLYAADFGDRAAQLELVARHVSEVRDCRQGSGPRLDVRYGRFDWTAASQTPPEAA